MKSARPRQVEQANTHYQSLIDEIDKVTSKHAKGGLKRRPIFPTTFCLIRQSVVSPLCSVTNSSGFQLIDSPPYTALLMQFWLRNLQGFSLFLSPCGNPSIIFISWFIHLDTRNAFRSVGSAAAATF